MKRSNRVKLIGALVVLLAVAALTVAGTFAWYTLSKKGELNGIGVSFQSDGDEWPFYIIQQPTTMSETMTTEDILALPGWKKDLVLAEVEDAQGNYHSIQDSYQLRPVSTSDGVHWYTANYGSDGAVIGLDLEELNAIANINRQNLNPVGTGSEIPANYLYYYDMWIKTESAKHDYELHLGNPINMQNISAEEIVNGFGTYVFPGLIPEDDPDYATKSHASYDASTCIRMGFLIYDQAESGLVKDETPGQFWIYEPNSDLRATAFKDFQGTEGQHNSYAYQENMVYVFGDTDGTKKKVVEHEGIPLGTMSTVLPKYIEGVGNAIGHTEYQTFEDKTIQQLHSTRNSDGEITDLGEFISLREGGERPGYEGIDTPGMVTVQKGKPQHIRVFIWLEGQDVDCWNSTLTGQMDIHLEFRGDAADAP